MVDSAFPSYHLKQFLLDDLLLVVSKGRNLAPLTTADGICRLLPMREGPFPTLALSTFLPPKKELIPPHEKVWSYQSERFSTAEEPQPFTVVGVPLCDLQAIWYLDQVFVDDLSYQVRRAQAFLVGMPCEAGLECRCDRRLMPIAGDLFIAEERVWALSPAGETLLKTCGCLDAEDMPLPWPEGVQEKRPEMTEELYHEAADAEFWKVEAKRCLSCGACSAVCPTCYCFDLRDKATLDGSVTRNRSWDNCFFAEHGKVAGGHDFRPGRANRLRFRMEHKFFSFGELRGQNSCVGCGRCRKVCPVDIDLDQIAAKIVEGGGS